MVVQYLRASTRIKLSWTSLEKLSAINTLAYFITLSVVKNNYGTNVARNIATINQKIVAKIRYQMKPEKSTVNYRHLWINRSY